MHPGSWQTFLNLLEKHTPRAHHPACQSGAAAPEAVYRQAVVHSSRWSCNRLACGRHTA